MIYASIAISSLASILSWYGRSLLYGQTSKFQAWYFLIGYWPRRRIFEQIDGFLRLLSHFIFEHYLRLGKYWVTGREYRRLPGERESSLALSRFYSARPLSTFDYLWARAAHCDNFSFHSADTYELRPVLPLLSWHIQRCAHVDYFTWHTTRFSYNFSPRPLLICAALLFMPGDTLRGAWYYGFMKKVVISLMPHMLAASEAIKPARFLALRLKFHCDISAYLYYGDRHIFKPIWYCIGRYALRVMNFNSRHGHMIITHVASRRFPFTLRLILLFRFRHHLQRRDGYDISGRHYISLIFASPSILYFAQMQVPLLVTTFSYTYFFLCLQHLLYIISSPREVFQSHLRTLIFNRNFHYFIFSAWNAL